MSSMFGEVNGIEIVFLSCALVGALFLVFRLILICFGVGHDVGSGIDVHGVDVHGGVDAHHADSDTGFKLISLYGLTSFFLMFGLVGFALYRQTRTGTLISLVGGVAAGLGAVIVIGRLFRTMGKLHSDGTIDTASAIGSSGTVYLTIPQSGTGRVTVNVKDRLREYDAVSHGGDEIRTGAPIRVVWVNGSTLVVERAAQKP
jgi:membrane protein implicated in regulation of membrane protease activity